MSYEPDCVSVLIGCLPIAQGPASVESLEYRCAECDEPIWVSHSMLEQAARYDEATFVCASHLLGDKTATVPHWQREYLNSQGLSDEEIDALVRRVNSGEIKP